MKVKKTVALIFGGAGCEHSVSVMSARYVFGAMDREWLSPLPVVITEKGEWLTVPKPREFADLDEFIEVWSKGGLCVAHPLRLQNGGGLLVSGEVIPLDAALPLLHGDMGEDGTVQGALDILGIPYVGCRTGAGALCADKTFTKSVAVALDIPTLPWVSGRGMSEEGFCRLAEGKLGFPLFLKPISLGSSVGASAVKTRADLTEAYAKAYAFAGCNVMAEPLIDSPRELECAFFSAGGRTVFTSVGEISTRGGFYDYEAKYSKDSRASVCDRADLDPVTSDRIKEYSKRLSEYVGCRGLSRIDFFLDSRGNIYFNEINTMPGMTEGSLYPRLLLREGISLTQMLNALIEDCIYAGDI